MVPLQDLIFHTSTTSTSTAHIEEEFKHERRWWRRRRAGIGINDAQAEQGLGQSAFTFCQPGARGTGALDDRRRSGWCQRTATDVEKEKEEAVENSWRRRGWGRGREDDGPQTAWVRATEAE
jgi:hypothetical protein